MSWNTEIEVRVFNRIEVADKVYGDLNESQVMKWVCLTKPFYKIVLTH